MTPKGKLEVSTEQVTFGGCSLVMLLKEMNLQIPALLFQDLPQK